MAVKQRNNLRFEIKKAPYRRGNWNNIGSSNIICERNEMRLLLKLHTYDKR